MQQRASFTIVVMLGTWACAFLVLSQIDRNGRSHLRGPPAVQPTTSIDPTRQQRRAAGIPEGGQEMFHRTSQISSVEAEGRSDKGRNDECQLTVDDRGNTSGMYTGRVLKMNEAVSGVVSDGGYEFFTVCVSQHRHHHRVDIGLLVQEGEADLYVSASEPHPRVERGSAWISAKTGEDHISLPTYAEDFASAKPNALFIGVHGRPGGKFSLEVEIGDVAEREIAAHTRLGRHRD